MPWSTSGVGRFFGAAGRTARDTADRNNDGRASFGEWAALVGSGVGTFLTGIDFGGYGQRGLNAARTNFTTAFAPQGTPGYNYRGNEVASGPREYVQPPSVPIQPAGDYTPNGVTPPQVAPSGGGNRSNRPRAGGAYVAWAVGPNANSAARRSNLITGGYESGGALGMGNRQVMRQSAPEFRRALVQPR